jgi:DnaJ-class molecular chaperone
VNLPHSLPDAPTPLAAAHERCPVCHGECVVISEDCLRIEDCAQCDGAGRVYKESSDEWNNQRNQQ